MDQDIVVKLDDIIEQGAEIFFMDGGKVLKIGIAHAGINTCFSLRQIF